MTEKAAEASRMLEELQATPNANVLKGVGMALRAAPRLKVRTEFRGMSQPLLAGNGVTLSDPAAALSELRPG